MSSTAPARKVRISRIGGRYLVFDIEDVVYIRRHHSICAIFTGTMPQNPTQNIFLGLPIELYAEEARLLIDKKAAYVAEDATEHLSQLRTMDVAARKAYLQSLRTQRTTAQLMFENEKTKSRARYEHMKPKAKATTEPSATAAGEEETPFGSPSPTPVPSVKATPAPAITPTTSSLLIAHGSDSTSIHVPESYPLYAYLNSKGYYITPGLRFGGDYSVYPGDPFRFHAHYLANSYRWDQEIPMLDLLTSGRLGTAVKKSFLFGAENPVPESKSEESGAGGNVRVFCIEWAGM